MADSTGRILIRREEIARRVREVGEQVTRDLGGAPEGDVVLLTILTGALVFTADLIRAMPIRMSIATLAISSYPGRATTSRGPSIEADVPGRLEGKHVLIVDDILDTGRTLALVRDRVLAQRPASLRIVVLLRKMRERDVPVEADYACFEIPDEFVVGCGLDYDGLHRNLPDIRVLEPEDRAS